MTKAVYLAGPLFTHGERAVTAAIAEELQDREYKVLDPWDFCKGSSKPEEIARQCIENLQVSDLVLACLNGADVDSGTAFEVGYAIARKCPVIGYRSDFRKSGDDVTTGVNAMFSLVRRCLDTCLVVDLNECITAVCDAVDAHFDENDACAGSPDIEDDTPPEACAPQKKFLNVYLTGPTDLQREIELLGAVAEELRTRGDDAYVVHTAAEELDEKPEHEGVRNRLGRAGAASTLVVCLATENYWIDPMIGAELGAAFMAGNTAVTLHLNPRIDSQEPIATVFPVPRHVEWGGVSKEGVDVIVDHIMVAIESRRTHTRPTSSE